MEKYGASFLMFGTSLQALDHIVWGIKNRKRMTWPYVFDGFVWLMLAVGATLVSMSVSGLAGWAIPIGLAIFGVAVVATYRLRAEA